MGGDLDRDTQGQLCRGAGRRWLYTRQGARPQRPASALASSLWTWDYQYLGVCFRGPNGLTVLGLPYLLHCLVQRHLPVTTLHPITPLYPLQSKPLFPCSPPNPRALTSGSRGGGHLVPSGQYGLQPLEGVSCGVRPQETAVDAGGFSTGSARWLLLVETSFRREVCGPVAKLERSLAS